MDEQDIAKLDRAFENIKASIKKKKDFISKSDWPPEDRVVAKWVHCGIECFVLNGFVNFCGYVRLPKKDSHTSADDLSLGYIEVHGGVTFQEKIKGRHVIGFDTAHAGDFAIFPGSGFQLIPIFGQPRIWDIEDAFFETCRLAQQLSDREKT